MFKTSLFVLALGLATLTFASTASADRYGREQTHHSGGHGQWQQTRSQHPEYAQPYYWQTPAWSPPVYQQHGHARPYYAPQHQNHWR